MHVKQNQKTTKDQPLITPIGRNLCVLELIPASWPKSMENAIKNSNLRKVLGFDATVEEESAVQKAI